MLNTKRRDVTEIIGTSVVPLTAGGDWPVAPGDATLIAWDGHREANTLKQTRLYRLGNGRFLVIERCRDRNVASGVVPEIVYRELHAEEAFDLFTRLRVKMASEISIT